MGTAVTDLVRYVERSTGKEHQRKRPTIENLPDTVVQFCPSFARIDMLIFAPDNLTQIGLGEKAHRRAGPIIEISGLGDEFLAGLLNKADVGPWPHHRIARLLGRKPLKRIVEGERVHKDGPRYVCGIGWQAAMVFCVNFLRQCTGIGRSGNVVGNRRYISVLS